MQITGLKHDTFKTEIYIKNYTKKNIKENIYLYIS